MIANAKSRSQNVLSFATSPMNPNISDSSPANLPLLKTMHPIAKAAGRLFLLVIAVLAGYSLYVAEHEPDPQETVILGQGKLAAGSPAALRILVRHRISGSPVPGATVEMSLTGKSSGTARLGRFKTDAAGTLADPINVPDLAPGDYQLVVETASRLGRDHIARNIELQHPARILLSSDKPLYQPGQTIHLRSLVLNTRTQKPFTNEALTFEISDPKGNKVFKKESRVTSRFGIASADFVLASELNLGRYSIRALAGAATVERSVEIKRYVLPKFKIEIATDKAHYLPGETISGSLTANYSFGKPLSAAMVKLSAVAPQERPILLKELQGRTDTAGKYLFDLALPRFFAGMPQTNEQAFLNLTAEVRDSAGHAEEKSLSLSVAQHELEVTAIPEAGALVPGLDNLLYVLTTYPDGKPARCQLLVNGKEYQADAHGLCEASILPSDENQPIGIRAIDSDGRKRTLTCGFDTNRAPPPFLLRPDKAIYRAAEVAKISILSSDTNNRTVFLDVIKDGQTVLTKSVPLQNHSTEYALTLPPSLAGALTLNAYFITDLGEDRGCSRTICVNPASGLQIRPTPSKPFYRPGETAKIDFAVTDSRGNPAPAALGIAAVDESVFAIDQNRPGLLKDLLESESEPVKRLCRVNSFDSPSTLLQTANQPLAAAYFASLSPRRSGPSLDDLVRDGYISSREVEFARRMRGTPAYERFRSNPDFAEALRILEGAHGTYNLREATGPLKLQATEAYRMAYFRKLRDYLKIAFFGLVFCTPLFLVIYYSRPGAGRGQEAVPDARSSRYAAIATSLHNVMGALILVPLACYPIGLLALEPIDLRQPGWLLLALEVFAVLVTLLAQYDRIVTAASQNLKTEMAPLRVYLASFLIQFLFSRFVFVLLFLKPRDAEILIACWAIASVIAPLVVLAALGSHIGTQFALRAMTRRTGRLTIIEVLVVIAIVAMLSAMLLPALAKAKARGSTVALGNELRQIGLATQTFAQDNRNPGEGGSVPPRVRRDFPETLLWQPELITDDQGKATLEFPLADSITTWRASIDAINGVGKIGNLELPIKVFQDFFVDLDLPVSMSLGDEVAVPITCYNYLNEPQTVRLAVSPAAWFSSSTSDLTAQLGPNEVKSVSLPIKVLRVGGHSLRITAQGTKLADAVEREIRVVPAGERFDYTRNEVLKDTFADMLAVPPDIVPDSQNLWVKFYPSRFSEVVEGLDGILRAPYGCFEQTSSTTYPNVLVLDYLKRVSRLTPEIEVRARTFINAGYQRLLTFEVPGGGFEWFGRAPANVCLTAYGILEFTDIARVHPVDHAVTERARKWLFGQQNSDGSWNEIHRGWTWGGRGSMTAFVAWALAESGDTSPNLDKALAFLRSHPKQLSDNYAKTLAANAFLARDRNDSFGKELAGELRNRAVAEGLEAIHWGSEAYSMSYSRGAGMETECTALCAMALMKAGMWPQSVKQALTWISKHKFADGTLGSTQATILAMRALLEGSSAALGQDFESTVTVLINDAPIETFRLNKENSDVMKQIELTKFLRSGENRIACRQSPSGELPFQLSGAYWLPGRTNPAPAVTNTTPLEITLKYDRTTLTVNDQLHCAVTVRNNTSEKINMPIVDLGIPPGFEADTSAFEAMQAKDQIAKFEVTGNQVVLYLRELSNLTPFQFTHSLRAKYPLRVQTPPSSVYEYYQPQNRAESRRVLLQASN